MLRPLFIIFFGLMSLIAPLAAQAPPGWQVRIDLRACQTITDFCVLGAAGWVV